MSETPVRLTGLQGRRLAPVEFDTTVGHPARVWDYWLGGKDNFAADREVGEELLAVMPKWAIMARADREFLARSVRHMVREAGLRQFLDIGTGIPAANNTHQVVQAMAPESRIVYVDNDPVVLAHARALLVSHPDGVTDYIAGDLHEPGEILYDAKTTLDLHQPIAVMLLGVLEFVPDHRQAHAAVRQIMDVVPPGSHLVIAHSTNEIETDAMDESARIWNKSGATPITLRDRASIGEFFNGLEVLEPGVVSCPLWRPDSETSYTDREVPQFCAVGRKTWE